eukprot:10285668-Karenia_brevis.AAC.1
MIIFGCPDACLRDSCRRFASFGGWQKRAGHFCVAGVANPVRCVPDAFVDVFVCATPVADSALARAL